MFNPKGKPKKNTFFNKDTEKLFDQSVACNPHLEISTNMAEKSTMEPVHHAHISVSSHLVILSYSFGTNTVDAVSALRW